MRTFFQSSRSKRLMLVAVNVLAAEQLGIPFGVISVAEPEVTNAASTTGQLPVGETAVMYRGRAVEKLVPSPPVALGTVH